ncbi:putative metal-binding motif-containing protein, partial [Myxococcota bacterium]|nr:putative metal-binding motif-containing protein [Myxococcota bacterium]
GDTYGDPNSMKEVSSCEGAPDEGEYKYVVDNSDCNDSDSAINPGQVNEGPCGDGIDQNCDDDPGDCALFQEVNVSELEPKPKSFSGATAAVALGNVDKDEAGLADFAVGFADSTMVQIFYGGFEDPAITISDSSTFGIALTVGYFDSDALPDLAVGGPSPAPGMVSVRLGVSGYTEASAVFTRESESISELGLAVQSLGSAMVGKVAFSYKVKDDNDNLSTTVWIPSDVLIGSSQCLSSVDVCLSGFKTDTDWPLALASATFGKDTYVGVGFSGGTGLTGPGLALYQINSTTAALTLTDKADSASALGASVAFGTLSDEKETSLVLVGAPGTGSVYMLEGRLSGTLSVDVEQDVYYEPVWTSTAANNAGSSVAFIGDIDLDGDEELAIGGDGVLWIIAQGESGFLGGNLDSTDQPIASGKITGFKGIIRHIVNAGDVDGDTFSDLLISTDSTTYLLYGGYKPAQEGASDTGN